MRKIRQKVASQKGASITFALLLFLVCAIISSVVIVAATAVGGRASKMAEMDQRYYAVNSAAGLVRKIIETPTVIVTTGKESKTTASGTTVTALPDEARMEAPDPADPAKVKSTPLDLSSDTSLITTAALKLAGVDATVPTLLSLTATGSGKLDASALGVTISPSLQDAEDTLILEISNTNNTAKGTYKLRMTLKASKIQSTDRRTTYGPKIPTSGGGYTQDETITEKTETTIQWKMIDLQAIEATPTTKPGGT